MQTRQREVSPDDMARLKGSRFPPHMDKGDVVWRDTAQFGERAVADYLSLARDPNPIHVSDDAAREVGLQSAVVPGMFFAGVLDCVVSGLAPTSVLTQMKLRFMAPVPVGDGLRLGVLIRAKHDDGSSKSVRVFVLRHDMTIAVIADLDVNVIDQAT
ncbi:MaoC/PaaZ C-terminal domain-containing protein [uncultured Shimia sp.]|uniref:MaoC family dehydratase n=1 Tax=uncultured Shimia sp. TaxID=573152 RepID=UPI0026118A2C|nr:MaoC/PaaZ C-terminal domain-containing protein [uncultured Shimia sp.]